MTRQKLRISVELDFDYNLARHLPEIPGVPGPDGHPPITGIEMIAEELRMNLLAAVAKEINTNTYDVSRIGAMTLGASTRFSQPYEPTVEPF